MALRAQLLVATALSGLAAGAAQAQVQATTIKRAPVAVTPALRAVVIPYQESAADKARIRAPAQTRTATIANTVTLRNADPAATIRALQVQRELGLGEIRTTKALQMGSAKLDLSAMLDHPDALPNVARKLEAAPTAVKVEAVDVRAYVVPQGLVVRSFLNYRLKPGACRDGARRAAIERAGVACPERQSESARIAGYSDPASPRFVGDPAKRAEAIGKARAAWAGQIAGNAAQVANFRAILANPAERAKVVADAGEAEVRRLEALDDEQLTGELVGTGETKIEDIMFIPRADKIDQLPSRDMMEKYRRDLLTSADRKQVANQPIDKVIFLTGFTLGREYEWSKRIEKTIKWCLVGCAETYHIEAKAGFSYGFGLRFPIELSGDYRIESDSSGSKAWMTATFDPIDGSPEQYLSAGLSSSQLFKGQEFVAQLKANAAFSYRLPIIGANSGNVDLGWDLAEQLPAPFKNGQFRPPSAGKTGEEAEFPFKQIDLLVGYGNWGAAGVLVHPAVKVGLHSDSLKLVLHDNIARTNQPLISGQRLSLAVDPVQKMSSFSIGSPVYNVGFIVTPGVIAHAFIDVGVWGDSWDIPVWFPQIAIKLPPGGIDFACHSGTICRRDYFYTAEGHTDLTGAGGEAMAALVGWASAFERDWTAACVTSECRTAIVNLRRSTQSLIEDAIKVGDLGSVDGRKKIAEGKASALAYGSQDRIVTTAVAEAKPRCRDDGCPANLDRIGGNGIDELNARRSTRVLPWDAAQPVAVTMVNDWIRVELMNSQLRAVRQLGPDIPVMPQPSRDAGQVAPGVVVGGETAPAPIQPVPVLPVPIQPIQEPPVPIQPVPIQPVPIKPPVKPIVIKPLQLAPIGSR